VSHISADGGETVGAALEGLMNLAGFAFEQLSYQCGLMF
jgi:hypothetical protein